jgi:membrane protease YdiL (CAAX protease family)
MVQEASGGSAEAGRQGGCAAGLYSLRRLGIAADPVKRARPDLLDSRLFSRMDASRLVGGPGYPAATRPANYFASSVCFKLTGFSARMSTVGGSEMSSTQSEPSEPPKPRQSGAWIQLLAVIIGVLPLYSSLIIYQLRRDQPLSMQGFIFYLAVICPLAVVIALLLLRFLCGENPRDLNLRPGKLSSDLLAALILCPVIIVANVVSNYFLSELLPDSASNTSVRNLFVELSSNPGLLVLFVGLLIPLGAVSEEVIRVFLLSRFWKVWPSTTGELVAVVISVCLFGLIHVYRGPASVASTAIFGLIMALYYLRFGRAVPLILAHYLTNALQVVVFAVRAR